MKVEYHPAVQLELEKARDYYDGQLLGLGSQFLDEFERLVLRIVATPGRWMRIKGDVQRALMSRFPYIICFRQVGSDKIRITVVKHQRRHPGYGLERR